MIRLWCQRSWFECWLLWCYYTRARQRQDNDKTNVEPVHSYDAFHARHVGPGVEGIIGMHSLVVVLLWCENTISLSCIAFPLRFDLWMWLWWLVGLPSFCMIYVIYFDYRLELNKYIWLSFNLHEDHPPPSSDISGRLTIILSPIIVSYTWRLASQGISSSTLDSPCSMLWAKVGWSNYMNHEICAQSWHPGDSYLFIWLILCIYFVIEFQSKGWIDACGSHPDYFRSRGRGWFSHCKAIREQGFLQDFTFWGGSWRTLGGVE